MELSIYKAKKDNLIYRFIPYVILLAFILASSYTLFYEGYPMGDDYAFHFSSILDLYESLKNNYVSPISSNLASGYGIGKLLFYSPLPHMAVAIIAYIIGRNIIVAFKIVYLFSVIVSAYTTYIFSYKISKNRFIALVSASFFAFYPYRLFDATCRIAYAEAVAFMFIPVFFLGIYEFVNLDKCEIKPFIEIIIGASGLYLSHNITALFSYLFGFIFLICYIDKIIKLIIKDKKVLLYGIITLIITIGFMSIVLFSSFELLKMDYYNVSEKDRMWTSRDYVTHRFDYMNYSGFLNYKWLNSWNIEEVSPFYLVKDIIFFISLVLSTILISKICEKYVSKKYYFIFSLIYYLILSVIFARRIELIIALIIFICLYLLKIIFAKANRIEESRFGYIYFGLVIISLLMVCFSFIWQIIPEIFLNIQFPWRLWTFFSFFSAIFLAYFMARYNFTIYFGVFLSAFLIVTSQPLVEKRIVHDNTTDSWITEINSSIYEKDMSIGANLEYLPKSFYYNEKYKSLYENSIHNGIQEEVAWTTNQNPYYYSPVILKGEGNINVVKKNAPNYVFNINATTDALIEIPLFYYPGYEIKVTNLDNNEITYPDILDIDSLLTFNISKGNYKIEVSYKGTTIQSIGKIYYKSAFLLIILFYSCDTIYYYKKRKYLNY